MKRLISILAATSALLGGGVGVVTAHENPNQCGTNNQTPSSGFSWDRSTGSVGNINGVRAQIIANILEPCSQVMGGVSKDYAIISMEGTANGTTSFPQLGLCKFVPPDQTYWCYMKPDAQGIPVKNPTWVQPLGNPVGGRTYELSIYAQDSLNHGVHAWTWHYSLTDTVTGGRVTKDEDIPGTTGNTTSISFSGTTWWGCETGNSTNGVDYNALLNFADDPNVYITEAGYKLTSDGLWHYTQNSQVRTPALWAHFSDQTFSQTQNGPFNSDKVSCWNTN